MSVVIAVRVKFAVFVVLVLILPGGLMATGEAQLIDLGKLAMILSPGLVGLALNCGGIKSGGCRFSRGALYELLANPIYIGEIRHKQERHPGLHEAILSKELWERVQQRLNENAARGRGTSNRSITSPLAGKLFDADGQPLYVQGATKGRRRYRYYVSKCLVNGSARDEGKGWRLSAPELERAVVIAARHILSDRAGLLEALEKSGIDSPDLRATLESASNFSRRLQNEADAAAVLVEVVSKVEMRDDGITVTLRIEVQCSHGSLRTSSNLDLSRFVPLRMKRRGVETRIIIAAGDDLPRKVDPALLKAVARSRRVTRGFSAHSRL